MGYKMNAIKDFIVYTLILLVVSVIISLVSHGIGLCLWPVGLIILILYTAGKIFDDLIGGRKKREAANKAFREIYKIEMEYRTCKKCRTVNEKDAKFCKKCGERLRTPKIPPTLYPYLYGTYATSKPGHYEIRPIKYKKPIKKPKQS